MKAIVTGATGMIGWNLIKYLTGQGMEVLAIVNPLSKRKGCIPKHKCVTIIECDLSNLMSIELDDVYDQFYHLGWKGTYGESREDLYLQEQNIREALIAVDFAAKAGCKVFVGAGSQAEYGANYNEKLNGSLPARPESGYGIGKYTAGIMTRKRCVQLGIRHQWVRILSIYGPGDGNHTMVMSSVQQMLSGKVPAYTAGEQEWDYLYVEDAAEALYQIAEKGIDQKIYCLGNGNTRLLKDYIRDIRDVAAPSLEIKFGELPYAQHQVMYLCADLTELQNDTGFTVKTEFKEGMRKTLNWVREKVANEKN